MREDELTTDLSIEERLDKLNSDMVRVEGHWRTNPDGTRSWVEGYTRNQNVINYSLEPTKQYTKVGKKPQDVREGVEYENTETLLTHHSQHALRVKKLENWLKEAKEKGNYWEEPDLQQKLLYNKSKLEDIEKELEKRKIIEPEAMHSPPEPKQQNEDKSNFWLDEESIEYYDNKIKEAEIELKEAEKRVEKGEQEQYKLYDYKRNLMKAIKAKQFRVFELRLYYDYPIELDEYLRMTKKLNDVTIWLRNFGFFEGKRKDSYDQHIGTWNIQASLTARNMKELKNGIKKSWRHIRWKDVDYEDYSRSPYIYEINGKKYVAYDIKSLKEYIKRKK